METVPDDRSSKREQALGSGIAPMGPSAEQQVLSLGGVPRPAHIWTLDKLEIVRRYLAAFAKVCMKKPGRAFLADAFCGPGLNQVQGEVVYGTPLIALHTKPAFTRYLFADLDPRYTAELRAAAAAFADITDIRTGDCNEILAPALREMIGPWDPCVVLLDPEGSELAWETVAAISRVPKRRYKIEQLILLPTHTGFYRLLNSDGEAPPHSIEKMNKLFGPMQWQEIYRRRVAGEIDTNEMTRQYVTLYADGLKGLGYKTVLDRAICDNGHSGRTRYFMMFATDNETGKRIMDNVFDSAVVSRIRETDPKQLSLLPPEKPRRRRRLED